MRVTPQDFTPCIHITDSDFASITQDGALCDANGQLGPDEFADVIRRQVGLGAHFVRRRGRPVDPPPGGARGRFFCGAAAVFAAVLRRGVRRPIRGLGTETVCSCVCPRAAAVPSPR